MVYKKKILIVTSEFPPQPGGIGNHAYYLALNLSKQEYKVELIADQRSKTGKPEAEFDQNLPFTVVRIKRNSWRFKMYLKRIYVTYVSFINATNVIATGKFSLWNVAFLSLFFKRKTLAVVHGSEVNFKSILLKKSIDIALQKMDVIVAVSEYTKSLILHLNKNIEVIPNGIDLVTWEQENLPEMCLKGSPVLTTVGRVSARKGQLQVIQHLPKLITHFPKLHYHCIGIPTEAKAFMKVAKSLQVQSHISFHGSLDNLLLKEILCKTDIFIMLSTESKTGDVEGFGIAILEANALGVPAIGSRGCGIEEAIKHNGSGVLIDPNSTSQMLNGIKTILQNKTDYNTAAKEWAKQHDWSNIITHYIALLK